MSGFRRWFVCLCVRIFLLTACLFACSSKVAFDDPDTGAKDAARDAPVTDAGADSKSDTSDAPVFFGGYCDLGNGWKLLCNGGGTEDFDVCLDPQCTTVDSCHNHNPDHCPMGGKCRVFDPNSDALGGIGYGVCK